MPPIKGASNIKKKSVKAVGLNEESETLPLTMAFNNSVGIVIDENLA